MFQVRRPAANVIMSDAQRRAVDLALASVRENGATGGPPGDAEPDGAVDAGTRIFAALALCDSVSWVSPLDRLNFQLLRHALRKTICSGWALGRLNTPDILLLAIFHH